MESISVREVVKAVGGKLLKGNLDYKIAGISTDTRTLKKGDMFFALKGKNHDAHDFVETASNKGSPAVVISTFNRKIKEKIKNIPVVILVNDTTVALGNLAGYYRRKYSPYMIGVTGSNGKTTTKEMIASVLSMNSSVLKTEGNYNNLIGVPLTIFKLNKTFKYCVFELGISFVNEMNKLLEIIMPDIGVVTNIGRTHLEYLKNLKTVLKEKVKLYFALPADGTAIINNDDKYLREFKSKLRCKKITYGLKEDSDVFAKEIKIRNTETDFVIIYRGKKSRILIKIPGLFNVYNALAAVSTGLIFNLDMEEIKAGLEKFKPPPMRWEILKLSNGHIIINDTYNANPESMRNAIDNLVNIYKERIKIAVIGDMLELGLHTRKEHTILGRYLKELDIEKIYLYGEKVKYTFDELKEKNKAEYFSEERNLIKKLEKDIRENTGMLFFFKASRGIFLDRVVSELVRKFKID